MIALAAPGPETWYRCPTCPRGDRLWPASAFQAWESVGAKMRPKARCCNACLFERYRRTLRACATCGGAIAFHPRVAHVEFPQCRPCRSSGIPVCARCRSPLEGRASVGDVCVGCHARALGQQA